jgi:hypothetical protein
LPFFSKGEETKMTEKNCFRFCHFKNILCDGKLSKRKSGKWCCEFHNDIFDAIEIILHEKKESEKKWR